MMMTTIMMTMIINLKCPNTKQSIMEETKRLMYEAPVAKVLELGTECAILQMSPGEYPSWGEGPITT